MNAHHNLLFAHFYRRPSVGAAVRLKPGLAVPVGVFIRFLVGILVGLREFEVEEGMFVLPFVIAPALPTL